MKRPKIEDYPILRGRDILGYDPKKYSKALENYCDYLELKIDNALSTPDESERLNILQKHD